MQSVMAFSDMLLKVGIDFHDPAFVRLFLIESKFIIIQQHR